MSLLKKKKKLVRSNPARRSKKDYLENGVGHPVCVKGVQF